MMRRGVHAMVLGGLVFAMGVAPARAADGSEVEGTLEEPPEKGSSEYVQGWDEALSVGANLNLNSNDNVVGQVEGFSALFGLEVQGGLYYLSDPHEFKNTLKLNESWARTPSIGEFIKNNDTLRIQSLYNHFFLDWSGAFGRASLSTKLFTTNQVTSKPETYSINRNDGSTDTLEGIEKLELSDPFAPTSLQQAFGVFAKPLQRTAFSVTTRLGLGVHETFTEGVLALNDDGETDSVEVDELDNIYQGGTEGFVGVEGEFQNGRIGYQAGVTAFLPVVNNDSANRSAVELFSYEATGGAKVNVVDGVSASYNLRIFKDPQFIDRLQVQNSLVLTLAYQIAERETVEPPLEEQLEKARDEAEKARERVDALESRLENEEGESSGASDDEEETDTDRESDGAVNN